MSPRPRPRARPLSGVRAVVAVAAAVALIAGCTAAPGSATVDPAPDPSTPASPVPVITPAPMPAGTVTLYTTITAATVDAVVAAFQAATPGVTVEVFRAPTGEVAARIAAEQRDGGVRADLFWLTDPLSIQPYEADGLLAAYAPSTAEPLDAGDRTAATLGTRLLNLVLVTAADLTAPPADWADLADPALRDAVALPDPGFAGSAFALLGHFAQDPAYGMAFYQRLRDNGAVVVKSPDEVTTGVAEGRFKAGITLDFSARSAIDKGSPVDLVWPASGAVTMASPIAIVGATDNAVAARSFVDYVLSATGQATIAATGWQPVLPDVIGGPPIDGPQVRPDFAAMDGQQAALLADFRAIFGE